MADKRKLTRRQEVVVSLTLVILVLAGVAWLNRFIQDDAYISFRYARNLVDGIGLAYNPGERVEGYTNFLWTLVIAGVMAVGADPKIGTYLIGIGLFCVTLVFVYRIARDILGSEEKGLLAAILVGANFSFNAWATGGMETMLQTCLFAISFDLFGTMVRSQHWRSRRLAVLSVILALATLTRPDSVLLVGVITPICMYLIVRDTPSASKRWGRLAALTLPIALIVGGWLIWKLSYYGNILPNTFYVKVESANSLGFGIYYLYLFFLSYLYFPFIFLFFAGIRKMWRSGGVVLIAASVLIGLWMIYLVRVGGDFMEFRLLVPLIPMMMIIMLWLIDQVVSDPLVRRGLLILLFVGSIHHYLTFERVTDTLFVARTDSLEYLLHAPETDFTTVARVLDNAFEGDQDILVATSAAGLIPYETGLRTVDMLGLNDAVIAREGETYSPVPGHQRRTSFAYLLEREVNLILGNPTLRERVATDQVFSPADSDEYFFVTMRDGDHFPAEAQIIEIPISEDFYYYIVYLTPHPTLDRVIAEQGWRLYPTE